MDDKMRKYRGEQIARLIIIYLVLSLWAIMVIFPFYWMLITSLKNVSIYNNELTPKFLPIPPTLINYQAALQASESVNLGLSILNTIIYSVITTVLMLIVITLAAFAFARLKFKGKNIVFILFLSMMMIPTELVIVTNYTTIVNLNLRNTFTGLIFPSIMSIFYLYWLRQVFEQVPDEIYLAAKVDGTSDFKYLLKVLIPIARPTLISITLLKFIECWNSYIWPRLITTKADKFLISQAIQVIRLTGFGRDNIPAMMAAVVIVSIPIIIIFIIFRKQIMSGVAREGTKG